jgi:hypothetical protein
MVQLVMTVCEERGVNTRFGREILLASSIGSLHSGIPLNDANIYLIPAKGLVCQDYAY